MSMYTIMMNNFQRTVKTLFTKHLFVTNVVTCSSLLGVGDVLCQKLEHRYKTGGKLEIRKINWVRTGRMCTVGLAVGPVGHFWYKFLDKYIKCNGTKTVTACKKILADQILAAPFFLAIFFVGMNVLEGKGVEGGVNEITDKFLKVYMMDWAVWAPTQFINFYYLPPQVRMVYVSCITLIWDCILSFLKHKSVVHKPDLPNEDHQVVATS